MSTIEFAAPAATTGIQWKDHLGALLLIEPTGFHQDKPTAYGTSDAVQCDLTVLDGPGAGETYDDCLIFPTVLAMQTKSKIGQKVLARLGQGEAKAGQSPPWKLLDATADDTRIALDYLNKLSPPDQAL